MKKKTRRFRLHPIERQILRARWTSQAIDADLHAITGDNVDALLGKAGSMFYVALWAANADRIDPDTAEVRIIRGAVNTLGDLSGRDKIAELQRGAVSAGIEAVKRLAPQLTAESLYLGALELQALSAARPVMLSDFPTTTKRRTDQ